LSSSSDSDVIKSKIENCRIGRNGQERFWCGFCNKLVELKKKGLEAWTERFDHIDDHYMGRTGDVRRIQDWVPMDGNKPKDDFESLSPSNDSPVSSTSSLEGNSLDTVIHAGDRPGSSKRARSKSDDSGPPSKHPKTEKRWYCCQCNGPNNPNLTQRCLSCDGRHDVCSNCTTETLRTSEES